MNIEFTKKMKDICERTVDDIGRYFERTALEAHVFGSIARGTNDALSDIDIWITFGDGEIKKALENRSSTYAQFGQIILVHEMQNNFPLDGIQTAILYKIDDELIRVDWYLCPYSSSRILPGSRVLFENKKVQIGDMIYETKRTPRDLSDRVTFFINMCFIGIKKVVRKDDAFIGFLTSEFRKYEKEIPELATVPKENSFDMIKRSLAVLDTVSNKEQKTAIYEINRFMEKVESAYLLS
jgi:predicted nucleotidyltransferase